MLYVVLGGCVSCHKTLADVVFDRSAFTFRSITKIHIHAYTIDITLWQVMVPLRPQQAPLCKKNKSGELGMRFLTLPLAFAVVIPAVYAIGGNDPVITHEAIKSGEILHDDYVKEEGRDCRFADRRVTPKRHFRPILARMAMVKEKLH